jgi:radical SAM protein with 4Fe4S-binding SPASM domain
MCWWWGANGIGPGLLKSNDPLVSKVLTRDEILAVLKQLKQHHSSVYFSGGEPFARKDTTEIIEAASDMGLELSLTTNGLLLTDSIIDRLVRTRNLVTINVSIDGPRDVHDAIRGAGTFDKSLRNVKKLFERRRTLNQPEVRINTTITAAIIGRMRQFMRDVSDSGVDSISFQHLWFTDTLTASHHKSALLSDFGISDKGVDSHVVVVPGKDYGERVAAEISLLNSQPSPVPFTIHPRLTERQIVSYYSDLRYSKVKKCTAPWDGVIVKASGDVIFCPDEWITEFSIGNIREAPLQNLWNSERARLFRRVLARRGLFPACTRCCAININV